MGLQIQIAQTAHDEKDMIDVLQRKFKLLCLPRVWAPPPKPLGTCDAQQQVLFCEEFEKMVTDHSVPIVGETNRYHVFPKNGLCIEWDRSTRLDQGYTQGRYYFDKAKPLSEKSCAALQKVMALMIRTVKKNDPMTSGTDRYPIYLGPDLSNKVRKNEAQLVYPDGTPRSVSDGNAQAQIQRILPKLKAVQKKKVVCFGSTSHHFRLRAPLSPKILAAFEKKHAMRLPEDYREFLLHAGNGGAGPYYGLLPLDQWAYGIAQEEGHLPPDYLQRPHPHAPQSLQGQEAYQWMITLVSEGCANFCLLIVSGASRGCVVSVDRDAQTPLAPRLVASNFLTWYEQWLDEVLC